MERLLSVFFIIVVIYVNLDIIQSANKYKQEECGKVKAVANLTFDTITHHGEVERVYRCKNNNEVLNIPEGVKFECQWDDYRGLYYWNDKTNYKFRPENLTCQEKVRCDMPPPVPVDNMNRRIVNLYMYSKDLNEVYTFYDGDKFQYDCLEGFFRTSGSSDQNSSDFYYDYLQPIDFENFTKEIVCSNEGVWKDTSYIQTNLGNCTAIVCNAKEFSVIRNGYVFKESDGRKENHTDEYSYGDIIRVECDEGYTPSDNIDHAQCFETDSFRSLDLNCKPIRCPEPPDIANGNKYATHERYRMINSTVAFDCEVGYILSGKPRWTCQEDGSWDGYCTKCDSDDTYCPSPCVPEGSILTLARPSYSIGSVIHFECKGNVSFGGSQERTCLRNRQWSGTDIDCTGKLTTVRSTTNLKMALADIALQNNLSAQNALNEDVLVGKSFRQNQEGGTDIFISIDVSGSITEVAFNTMKELLDAIIQKLDLSSTDFGTRLSIDLFGDKVYNIHNNHIPDLSDSIYDADDWKDKIENLTLADAQKHTGKGTNLKEALENVRTEILSKSSRWQKQTLRLAQQVLIVISDGEKNTGGKAVSTANILKTEYNVDIYSICITSAKSNDGKNAMKEIASGEGDKKDHFFVLPLISNQQDYDKILKSMIEDSDECIDRGCTNPQITKYKDEANKHDFDALLYAWPWMAQINKHRNDHLCGGSIIDQNWILTAAHCFDDNDTIYSIALGKIERTKEDTGTLEKLDVCGVIKHPDYDKSKFPAYRNDIALVKVKSKIPFSQNIHAVYLASSNETDYEKTFIKSGQFGVVTGWGKRKSSEDLANKLKQMQMEVQLDQTCEEMVGNYKQNVTDYYDSDLMFCAGGKDGNKTVDTCEGDSGGPFVVPFPDDQQDKQNHFVQIGIVSYGIGKECKREGVYGIYTKLNTKILQWIENTMKEDRCPENKRMNA